MVAILHRFVIYYNYLLGLVKAVARDLYQQAASVQFVSKSQHVTEGGKTQEHVIFKVQLRETKTAEKEASPIRTIDVYKPAVREGFQISAVQFCHAFPYHVIFNEKLEIQQCGRMIQRVVNCHIRVGMKMPELFDIVHPIMKFTIDNIRTFINSVFMLGVRFHSNGHRFTLKGICIMFSFLSPLTVRINAPVMSNISLKKYHIV